MKHSLERAVRRLIGPASTLRQSVDLILGVDVAFVCLCSHEVLCSHWVFCSHWALSSHQLHLRQAYLTLVRNPERDRGVRKARLEPLDHQNSRRNDTQVITLLGSQATGLYDHTVVSSSSKDVRSTALSDNDNNPSRLINKYLDMFTDHKIRHRPGSSLPFHPLLFSLGGMMNGDTTKVSSDLWKGAKQSKCLSFPGIRSW
jgi:hypothetical protein